MVLLEEVCHGDWGSNLEISKAKTRGLCYQAQPLSLFCEFSR